MHNHPPGSETDVGALAASGTHPESHSNEKSANASTTTSLPQSSNSKSATHIAGVVTATSPSNQSLSSRLVVIYSFVRLTSSFSFLFCRIILCVRFAIQFWSDLLAVFLSLDVVSTNWAEIELSGRKVLGSEF